MSDNEAYVRKILNATVTVQKLSKTHVLVRVQSLLFKKDWQVPVEDARWVRDRLFEMVL
jgi:hypothetical protein